MAAKGHINLGLFLAMLSGLSLIIGSGCVFNNYLDREIDKKMKRTKARALAANLISTKKALLFGLSLGIAGFLILTLWTNTLTSLVALAGFVIYVLLYTYFKRRTSYATIIGSAAGAVSPVVGYTAISNKLGLTAGLFFLTLVLWQIPHFYSIAIYRASEYKAAELPVLPLVRGFKLAKIQIFSYIGLFTIAIGALAFYSRTGVALVVISVSLGLGWLSLGFKSLNQLSDKAWARRMFHFSLIVITLFSLSLIANAIIKTY